MGFGREMDLNQENVAQHGVLGSLWNMAFQLIKYPIEHPAKALVYVLWFNIIKDLSTRVYHTYYDEDNIKLPLDALHKAYRGPSFVYVRDKTFDPAKDLIGCTTDRHPSGYYDLEGPKIERREVTTSFDIEKFSKKDQEGLLKRRSDFYHWCALEASSTGYGNILSHRSSCGDMQSTFGFYGDKNLDTLAKYHHLDVGFVVGIRAFGNTEYFSTTHEDKTTYQLVKIDLDKIDMTQVNFEYNTEHDIAHVYVKDGQVCQHPLRGEDKGLSFIQNWTVDSGKSYIKNLPNFVPTVDWVISATDVPKALSGGEVEDLLYHKKINIAEWQKVQENINRSPLKHYSIFALPRPGDYGSSFLRNEAGQFEMKPPLLFKIGKESEESTDAALKSKTLSTKM